MGRGAPPRGGSARGRAFGYVCLLKGADTLIAAPGRACSSPRSALRRSRRPVAATCLTGILAAFLAKGMEPRSAAAAAAAAQQLASTLIPQSGAIASDIVGALPRARCTGRS